MAVRKVTVEFTVSTTSAYPDPEATEKVRAALKEVSEMLRDPFTPNELVHLTDFWIRRVE